MGEDEAAMLEYIKAGTHQVHELTAAPNHSHLSFHKLFCCKNDPLNIADMAFFMVKMHLYVT